VRWIVFLIAAVVALVFDTGPAEVLRIEKLWDIRPSLCAVVVVFVALSAPRGPALWACLLLGVLRDLCNPLTTAGGEVVYLIGPYALGYTAAAWIILQLRSSVFRRRALTIGVMTMGCLVVSGAIALVIFAVRSRGWYPGGPIHATDMSAPVEVLRRGLIAVYSGILAVPAGWLLVRSMPAWGFQNATRTPAIR